MIRDVDMAMNDCEELPTTTITTLVKRKQTVDDRQCWAIVLAALQIVIGGSIIGSGVAYNIILPDLGYWWCLFTGGNIFKTQLTFKNNQRVDF